jgi:hypothetical protein
VVGVVSSSRAIARVACVGRLQHDPYPQQLPLLGAAGAQPRLKDRAISGRSRTFMASLIMPS